MERNKKAKKKNILNFIEAHPSNVGSKPVLDPTQVYLGKFKVNERNVLLGNLEEDRVEAILRERFPSAVILRNVYIESGYYYEALKLYSISQIDFIVILENAIVVVEVKHIEADVIKLVADSGKDNWKVFDKNNRVLSKYKPNGMTQNATHGKLVSDIIKYERLDLPVLYMTIVGGPNIKKDMIEARCYRNEMLIAFEEIEDAINDILVLSSRHKSAVGQKEVLKVIEKYRCRREGIEKLHRVLLNRRKACQRNKKLELSDKCPGIVRYEDPYIK